MILSDYRIAVLNSQSNIMNEMSNDTAVESNNKSNVWDILMQISFPYIIFVSIIGICGNFLTIVILSKKSLSRNFNNCTLIALALTDLLFNLTLVSRCINDITQANSQHLCRLLSFLSHLAELLSACFTTHFTAQRFIAVRFPLSVFIEKKIHLLHYFIVSFLILVGIIYCVALVKNNDYDNFCNEELKLNWFLSDALLSFLIPFAIIALLNILIVLQLKKGLPDNQRFRWTRGSKQYRASSSPLHSRKGTSSYELASNPAPRKISQSNITAGSQHGSLRIHHKNHDLSLMNGRTPSIDLSSFTPSMRAKSQSYRVTRMLILVSTCFLLLNAPSHICTISFKIYTLTTTISGEMASESSVDLADHSNQFNQTSVALVSSLDYDSSTSKISASTNSRGDSQWVKLFYIIVILSQHIAYASYSINFVLYSLCGMKFRRELVRYMTRQRKRVKNSRSFTT